MCLRDVKEDQYSLDVGVTAYHWDKDLPASQHAVRISRPLLHSSNNLFIPCSQGGKKPRFESMLNISENEENNILQPYCRVIILLFCFLISFLCYLCLEPFPNMTFVIFEVSNYKSIIKLNQQKCVINSLRGLVEL